MTVKIDAPTWQRREQIAEWLRTEGQVEMLQQTYGMNACILGTRLTVGIMRAFNLDAQPCPVTTYVFSPSFSAYLRDEKPHFLERLADMEDRDFNLNLHLGGDDKRGCSVIGLDGEDAPGSWAGHVGALTGNTFIDLTVEQAQRPSLSIMDLEPLIETVSDEFIAGTQRHVCWQGDVLIAIQRTNNYRFVDTPDWCESGWLEPWIADVAAKIEVV